MVAASAALGNSKKGPKQSFLGYMIYNRLWFDRDKYGLTIGGGQNQQSWAGIWYCCRRINGATAASGTPYFTENPGDPYKAWDVSGTFDWMPSQYITFRWEYNHRAANVPYFSGSGGVTPPAGNTFGAPGALVCLDGSLAPSTGCGTVGLWRPDLRKERKPVEYGHPCEVLNQRHKEGARKLKATRRGAYAGRSFSSSRWCCCVGVAILYVHGCERLR